MIIFVSICWLVPVASQVSGLFIIGFRFLCYFIIFVCFEQKALCCMTLTTAAIYRFLLKLLLESKWQHRLPRGDRRRSGGGGVETQSVRHFTFFVVCVSYVEGGDGGVGRGGGGGGEGRGRRYCVCLKRFVLHKFWSLGRFWRRRRT